MIGNVRAKTFLTIRATLPCLPVSFAVMAILVLAHFFYRDLAGFGGRFPSVIVIGGFALLIT